MQICLLMKNYYALRFISQLDKLFHKFHLMAKILIYLKEQKFKLKNKYYKTLFAYKTLDN